ncbi:MAG: hypothetical protein JJT75_12220 [Opitutales bacterium]|nr:hypothetical protein [Opitutales bacterium]
MKNVLNLSFFMVTLFVFWGAAQANAEGLPPLKGLDVVGKEPAPRMNPQELAIYLDQGLGTYWTDRSLLHSSLRSARARAFEFPEMAEPVWGESVSLPSEVEWIEHTFPPGTVLVSRPQGRVGAGEVLYALQNMANYHMVEPGGRAGWQLAIYLAELYDTDLALDLADAWMRTAAPEEVLSAYMRRTMVLANAGRLDEIDTLPGALKTDHNGHRSPWMEEIFISRETWYRWGRSYNDTQKRWQAFYHALALGNFEGALKTWNELQRHMEEDDRSRRYREWWSENKSSWEVALHRLDNGVDWQLSAEEINHVRIWREFLKGWTHSSFAEELEDFSREDLLALNEAAEDLFGPYSLEYADLLLYALEQRGVWSLSWNTQDLIGLCRSTVRPVYGITRPLPLYFLVAGILSHRPDPEEESTFRDHYLRRGTALGFIAQDSFRNLPETKRDTLYRLIIEDYQSLLPVVYEFPKHLTDRGIVFRQYRLLESHLGVLEHNSDFWMYLLKNERRRRLRGAIQTSFLTLYHGELAKQLEVMRIYHLYHPSLPEDPEEIVSNLIRNAFHRAIPVTEEDTQLIEEFYQDFIAEIRDKHPEITINFEEIYEKYAPNTK